MQDNNFDENLVNAFMSISVYEILKVIVNDVTYKFDDDEILLKEFNLNDLYAIVLKEDKNSTEKRLIEIFDKFYHYNA